jgi:Pentapeptide repeats (9 copies)
MPRRAKKAPSKALVSTNDSVSRALGRRIVLTGNDLKGIFQHELRGVVVTGHVRRVKTAPECNIVETVLTSLTVDSSTFTSCDIKDSSIQGSRFVKCDFGSSSITHNAITNSVFEKSSFRYTDIQQCDLMDTKFLNCDLRNLLIKNCTFTRCEFRGCITSNKLLEMSLLTDCVFEKTDLQIETLAENFGITASGFKGQIRDGLAEGSHKIIDHEELKRWLRLSTAHPVQKLGVDYFLKETLLEGSPHLDASLDIRGWLPMFRTAGSFVVVLTQLVDFLIWLYEHEKLAIHALICFHSLTDSMLGALSDASSHRQALAGIGGVHLSLARVVEPYLVVLEELTTRPEMEERLLVEGPGSLSSYRKALAPLVVSDDVTIKEIRPHNSPWEILFGFGAVGSKLLFLGLFLATRTKFELSRVMSNAEAKATGPTTAIARRTRSREATLHTEPIVSLDFGGSRLAHVTPNLRFRAYLPGNLVAELRLNIASKQIAKLRKTVKDLL